MNKLYVLEIRSFPNFFRFFMEFAIKKSLKMAIFSTFSRPTNLKATFVRQGKYFEQTRTTQNCIFQAVDIV